MILGIGVDIVYLPRIAALITRRGADRFARRILSATEFADWKSGSTDSVRFLAVRFSVKEAAHKAMYPLVRPTWKELSYSRFGCQYPGSKPLLSHEPIVPPLRSKVGQLHISVSHDGEYVVSTVLAEAPQQ